MTHGTGQRSFETLEAEVVEVERLTPRMARLRFKILHGKVLSHKPGQFVQVFVPQGEKVHRTSYSIASPPQHGGFELCVAVTGPGGASSYLCGLKPGDRVQALGPLGRFALVEPVERDGVFVAAGSGIAPLRSMIHHLLEKGVSRDIYLLFGNRFQEDILYRKEWEDLARRHRNFHLLFVLSRPPADWKGARGHVQDFLTGFVPDPAAKDFYLCGLLKMINAVKEALLSAGVSEQRIYYERYD